MEKVIALYKPVGITPLQLIQKFKEKYPEYKDTKLSYAGRLDPMADGLLLVLVDEENKKREQYQALSKEYECTVLFGLETDTYDILGKITHQKIIENKQFLLEQINSILPRFAGKQQQPYPPYSSQPVNGKPLYYWARQNKLSEITIPTKEIEIYTIKLISHTEITTNELKNIIEERVARVTGDFRQEEILETWKVFFENNQQKRFLILRLNMACSSGTYIRSLAHNLGKETGHGAIALQITRTAIGSNKVKDALHLHA